MSNKPGSLSMLAILLATATTTPTVVAFSGVVAIAQSAKKTTPEFPLLKTVKEGTQVRVNGSSSMSTINQTLAQKFQSQYPGTSVKATYDGADAGLKAVLDGKADVAGIGRELTDAEKAKGLVGTPVTRNKIAIFVGKENPLNQSLTINQFAQIFRGQITDWSKVGGEAGKIRMIDRPNGSDTRSAFANYPVFQNAPFKVGANAVKLTEDSTAAAIKAVGKDGISYAIADQVVDNPSVRVLPMHQVLPTDQRYPFSQPLMYVYKGEKPNPAVQAFLGYATAAQTQAVVEQARVDTVKSPEATANPPAATATVTPQATATAEAANNATSTPTETNAATGSNVVTSVEPADPNKVANAPAGVATATDTKFPWWLLLIPLLGGMLWWLLKNLNGAAPAAVAPVAAGAAAATKKRRESRLILTPRDARNGYAYWEIPESVQEDLRRQGKQGMKLRLYDVTDIDMDIQNPHSVQEFNCSDRDRDLHLPIPADNREYAAEIGYPQTDGSWYRVARSQPVRFPGSMAATTIPSQSANANTTTDLSSEEQAQAASLWDHPQDTTPHPSADVDTEVNNSINENTQNSDSHQGAGIAGVAAAGAAAVGGASLFNLFSKNRQSQPDTTTKKGKVDTSKQPQVIMVPRTPDSAYAYWEIPSNRQAELADQPGQKLMLRLYDTTGVDNFNTSTAQPFARYDCTGKNDLHVRIPESERDYIAEIGYEKNDGDWLQLAQTKPVHVPAIIPVETESNLDDLHLPGDSQGVSLSAATAKMAMSNVATNTSKTTNRIANTASNGINTLSRGTETTDETGTNWMSGVKKSMGTAIAGGAAAVAGVGTATSGFFNRNNESQTANQTENTHLQRQPIKARKQCQIILVPRNYQDAYAYWEISDEHKQAARNQGGRKFMLRVHDSTNIDIDYQQPHLTQEYVCNEQEFDKHVSIPTSDRDYIAEVGYYTDDNRWIRIIRSFHVHV